MLSEAKHLSAHRDRPFAALRVTNHSRSCLLYFIIARLRQMDRGITIGLRFLPVWVRRLLRRHVPGPGYLLRCVHRIQAGRCQAPSSSRYVAAEHGHPVSRSYRCWRHRRGQQWQRLHHWRDRLWRGFSKSRPVSKQCRRRPGCICDEIQFQRLLSRIFVVVGRTR